MGGDTIDATGASYVDPAPDPAFDLAAATGLRRQVYGFLPYWELSGASTKLNYDVLSSIAYFSVGADAKGNLKKRDTDGTSSTGWGGWTSSSMTQVINAAHQKGTRVTLTISVFAWTGAQASVQKAILGSSTARLNLVRQTVAAVRDRGADGVNLDFEPLASGYADEFVALLKTFRSEFNKVKPGYQVVYDTTGYIGNYPLEASVGTAAADAIFIMGYDYRTGSSSTAGSTDPLAGRTYDLADTVRAYAARVSPSRILLGIPWYGRAYSTSSDAVRSTNISGAKYGYSTPVNYESVVDYVARYGRRWDSAELSPYVVYRRQNCTGTYGCVTSWRQIYYDDATSMKLRYALVNDYNLRGAGMWALGYDGGHSELYRALSDSFLVDKAAPNAGVKALASVQRDEGFVVSWAAKDVSSIVSYDVQASTSGGPWTTWLTRTKATSDVWLGADGVGYAFRVRATDSKGHVGPWNVASAYRASPSLKVGGFGRVTLDGLGYRTGPDTAAAKLGAMPAGTIVAFTRGPVTADGYTWYELTQPIREWSPVSFVERGVWVAVASSSASYVKPWQAPNAALVDAGIRGMDFGSAATTGVGTGASASAVRAFSPDGDGSEDSVRIRWTNSMAMDALEVNVYRANGTLVGSRAVADLSAGAHRWDWNGQVNGSRVADGRYVLQLEGLAAGRTYRSPSVRPTTSLQVARYGVTVDTVPPVVSSGSASPLLISPNGDGYREATRTTLVTTGASRWVARVTSAAGSIVRTVNGTGRSIAWSWTGTDDGGAIVKDGRYAITLATYDVAGNTARRTWTATVDTAGPATVPAASSKAFSPNGDGLLDTTRLSFTSNEPATGTARIWKGTTLVRSWPVSAATTWHATWDGTRADGSRAADGTYALKVDVKDPAGNRRVTSTKVVVDRTGSRLRWSRNFFPQDNDALLPTSTLSWVLARDAITTLRLYDASGTLVRTAWSKRSQAAGTRSWTWNGRTTDGAFAPQGLYLARLTVTSPYATLETSRWVRASGFALTPSAATVKAGQTLTVMVRPVEAISTRPVVSFTQPGRTAVRVTATKLADGSYRATFRVATGSAGTGSVRVTATDAGGRVNATAVAIKVAS
ncbi:MAG: FlgD immunoglobulin-like domain containing protein [Candidatus Limnocylindrales bacterium]